MLFGKLKAQTTNNPMLNNFVTSWLGKPYRYGGTTMRGIDCSKLTQKLYKEVFGLTIPGVSWQQWSSTYRVSKDSIKTGDLVFFNSKKSPSGWHVGLYLADGFFLHASNRKEGVKISSLSENTYKLNYKGAGRLEKNVDE